MKQTYKTQRPGALKADFRQQYGPNIKKRNFKEKGNKKHCNYVFTMLKYQCKSRWMGALREKGGGPHS